MNINEVDKMLNKKFPKLFADRHCSPMESCFAFGLEIGSGWSNIVIALCESIQQHINSSRNARYRTLKLNRALRRALKGDKDALVRYYSAEMAAWAIKLAEETITAASFREVPIAVPQVVISQVKEKFGGLRFYYVGGDAAIEGMVRMAEGIASYTCEDCGSPGYTRPGGWLRTLCDTHAPQTTESFNESIEP